jgi:hypothetical protein
VYHRHDHHLDHQAGEPSSSDEDDEPMEEEGGSDFELDLSDDEGRPKKKGKKGAAAKVCVVVFMSGSQRQTQQ